MTLLCVLYYWAEKKMNKYLIEDRKYLSELAIKLGFANKCFLISGATGMIGKILVDVLLKVTTPSKIIAMGKNIDECKKAFDGKNIEYSSFETLNDIDQKVDYIIHLASPTNSYFLASKPIEVIDFIYTSTKKLLDFANIENSKFLFISSMEVFGEIYDEEKKNENDLGFISLESTRSSYPEAKRLCELLVKSYSSELKLNCYSARLAQTFGAGTSTEDPRVFGYFARCVLKNEDIILKTSGESYGNYCYIADTISAFLFILSRGISGETYNVVGDNTRTSIYDMAKMVSREFSNNQINVKIEQSKSEIFANSTKLNMDNKKLKLLGWRPNFDLKQMYLRMVER